MKLLLSLPDHLVKSIDAQAKEEGITRTGFIREVLREKLGPPLIQRASEMKVPVLDKVATAPPLEQVIRKTKEKVREFNSANFARPIICPKHGGQLLGGKYVCCE